jgi:hypothetical protein
MKGQRNSGGDVKSDFKKDCGQKITSDFCALRKSNVLTETDFDKPGLGNYEEGYVELPRLDLHGLQALEEI